MDAREFVLTDIRLVGLLTEAELFNGATAARAKPSPVEKVMLYSGSYAPDHPYLGMHIESLLDEDFIKMNLSSIPACWHPYRG